MNHLLDVSLLLACGWNSHARHVEARRWLESQSAFTTNPIAELGFIRVSMTPGFRATFEDAQTVLSQITSRSEAHWLPADLPAARLPPLHTHSEVTDAYLVELARSQGLMLATLDDELCKKPWAEGIVVNPL